VSADSLSALIPSSVVSNAVVLIDENAPEAPNVIASAADAIASGASYMTMMSVSPKVMKAL